MLAKSDPIDLNHAADALATALRLEDPRLVRVIARNTRMAIAHNGGDSDRHATQSLLLRQVERAADAGDYAQARPILSAFRSAVG